ncbi:hypothetical protein GS462_11305 [Rhodococcus hoagii]|nr:hypothetical protein [Prescottella equi]MBM4650999.1 hypothetical protein [Prescottella equi]MBM4686654.1 hypothetical protein [Prescottella equi]
MPTPDQLAVLIAAICGGGGIQAIISAVQGRRDGVRRRESDATAQLVAERDASRARADDMEGRYDRMTKERNEWREYGQRVHLWNLNHCQPPTDDYPIEPNF